METFDQVELAKQRNLLAAERTFSAWIRTGLGGVGVGFAIVRFMLFEKPENQLISDLVGHALIVWGIFLFRQPLGY